MIRSFEEFVEKTKDTDSADTLFGIYLEAIKNHGLDRAIFMLVTDHKDIGQKAGVGVIHNYPEDWMKYYLAHDFDKIDPVTIYGLSQLEAYTWQEMKMNMELAEKQVLCLDYGKEAGLHDGVAVTLRGRQNQLAGMGLASTEKKDAFDGKKELITAYTNHFYFRYKKISEQHNGPARPMTENLCLTAREREILKWVSLGKSNFDIGVILSISSHTVDFHMRKIYDKLGVNTRMLAVVKAISSGLISL